MTDSIKIIAEHSVDLSLINRESKVLDLGARSFSWSNAMLEYVDEIYCVEPDKKVKNESERIKLISVAVGPEMKMEKYVSYGNGTGNFLYNGEPLPSDYQMEYVPVWTLPKISHYFGVYDWGLIKMDVEKSEIGIIKGLTSPPAKQLSIEFHLHCGSTEEEIQECFTKLKKWYDMVVCDYSRKHGLAENYWDTLWLLK